MFLWLADVLPRDSPLEMCYYLVRLIELALLSSAELLAGLWRLVFLCVNIMT